MKHLIAFPGLGLECTIDRVAFQIFGWNIYWYGIIIFAGFFLGVFYIARNTGRYGFTIDQEVDVILFSVPVAIIFARAYYVLFYWELFRDNPLDVFKTWKGGLAIYGGVIGVALVVVLYGKYQKLSIADMADLAAPGLLIGQAIGRWGNFINAEAFGGPTDLPWGMSIDGGAPVHPTFFYESVWNAAGFLALHLASRKRRFPGQIFYLYLAWYGFGRMLIEGLRTDSLYLFDTGLRVSQVVAAVSMLVAAVLLVRGFRSHKTYAVPTEIQLPPPPDKEENV